MREREGGRKREEGGEKISGVWDHITLSFSSRLADTCLSRAEGERGRERGREKGRERGNEREAEREGTRERQRERQRERERERGRERGNEREAEKEEAFHLWNPVHAILSFSLSV